MVSFALLLKLYELPFTGIDSDGVDGVFPNDKDVDDLIDILKYSQHPQKTCRSLPAGDRWPMWLVLVACRQAPTEEFWTGGITNPLSVIEQISFLMFVRLLDINETRNDLAVSVHDNFLAGNARNAANCFVTGDLPIAHGTCSTTTLAQ